MTVRGPIVAAGAVVLRRRGGTPEVLLVHRPKYDDWTLPKGKLDPGETTRAAAVREVEEETGVAIRLGPALHPQTYSVGDGLVRPKLVHYWVGRVRYPHEVADYTPNAEVDEVRWVSVGKAGALLTYEHDRHTVEEALPHSRKTHPLIVLRHAQARSRRSWKGDDTERTLTAGGLRQADRLVPLLTAYGVERIVSSSSRRCWSTVAPYAEASGAKLEDTDVLSEEGATDAGVLEEVAWMLDQNQAAVLCTHRPVLPTVFEALGVHPGTLDPGAMVVVHHRHGRIASIERIAAPPQR